MSEHNLKKSVFEEGRRTYLRLGQPIRQPIGTVYVYIGIWTTNPIAHVNSLVFELLFIIRVINKLCNLYSILQDYTNENEDFPHAFPIVDAHDCFINVSALRSNDASCNMNQSVKICFLISVNGTRHAIRVMDQ